MTTFKKLLLPFFQSFAFQFVTRRPVKFADGHHYAWGCTCNLMRKEMVENLGASICETYNEGKKCHYIKKAITNLKLYLPLP